MKKVILSLVLILTSVCSFALPAGTYLNSCSGCMMFNGVLQCSCQDQNGMPRMATLSAGECNFNHHTVTNQNGILVCDPVAPQPYPPYPPQPQPYPPCYGNDCYHHHHHHYDRNLPFGSYQDTCKHCQVQGHHLYCECLNTSQQWVTTKLNLHDCYDHYLDVVNNNGQLTCGQPVKDKRNIAIIKATLNLFH